MPIYSKKSAYSETDIYDYYLDMRVDRPITKYDDDVLFTINETYNRRPDLLAFDLYGDPTLWWVFAQRNPDVLVNPLLDFTVGAKIYIPKLYTLKQELGF